MEKVCTKCGESKPLDAYYKGSGSLGVRSRCRACMTKGTPPGPKPKSPLERYEVDPDTGCWNWIGSKHPRGYGQLRWKGKKALAHRVVYELLRGPIEETDLDHLCRNTSCVNPDHLEPVSHQQNMARGIRATRSHCAKGHDYDGLYTSSGHRRCRQCNREAQRRYKQRIKANQANNQ